MSLRVWWKEPGVSAVLDEKRENRSRRVEKKTPPGSTSLLPENLELHGSFFWESLRRDPESVRLRQEWREISERQWEGKPPAVSTMSRVKTSFGSEVAWALNDFCAHWKEDYFTLMSGDRVPGGWLSGYSKLWKLVCKKGQPPLPFPWRFHSASKRVMKGAACTDLIVENQIGSDTSFEELLSQFRGRYTNEITAEFSLGSFASAIDSSGTKLSRREIEDVKEDIQHQRPRHKDGSEKAAEWDLDSIPLPQSAKDVGLLIDWKLLQEQLKPLGLVPKLVAVDPTAPEALLGKEFTSLLESTRGVATESKRLSGNAFEKIEALDREVLQEGLPTATTMNAFSKISGLCIEPFIKELRRLG